MKRHTTPFFSLPAPVKLVGLRPGEKLHEVMCPLDDSHLTLEFESSFVIRPSIAFFDGSVAYSVSGDGQHGHATLNGFEYRSHSNRPLSSVMESAQLNSAVTNEIT